MAKTEKQKAKDRMLDAYRNGVTPDPLDIALADRSDKGGRPTATAEDKVKRFYRKINLAYAYKFERKITKLPIAEAFESAKELTGVTMLEKDSLNEYCSYLKSVPLSETPQDEKVQWQLMHTRAALEQLEHGFMKLPNHPDYKPPKE